MKKFKKKMKNHSKLFASLLAPIIVAIVSVLFRFLFIHCFGFDFIEDIFLSSLSCISSIGLLSMLNALRSSMKFLIME